jgi:hypothetical protein
LQLKENALRSYEKHGDPEQLGYVPTAHFNTEARYIYQGGPLSLSLSPVSLQISWETSAIIDPKEI